jgi:hypothetical protein
MSLPVTHRHEKWLNDRVRHLGMLALCMGFLIASLTGSPEAQSGPPPDNWREVVPWVVAEGREGTVPVHLATTFSLGERLAPVRSRFKAYRVTVAGDEFIRRLDVLEGGDHSIVTISRSHRGGRVISYLVDPAGAWENGCVTLSPSEGYQLSQTESEQQVLEDEKMFWMRQARAARQ